MIVLRFLLIRIFHHVGHVYCGRRVVVTRGGDRFLHFLKTADAVASTACREDIANW